MAINGAVGERTNQASMPSGLMMRSTSVAALAGTVSANARADAVAIRKLHARQAIKISSPRAWATP